MSSKKLISKILLMCCLVSPAYGQNDNTLQYGLLKSENIKRPVIIRNKAKTSGDRQFFKHLMWLLPAFAVPAIAATYAMTDKTNDKNNHSDLNEINPLPNYSGTKSETPSIAVDPSNDYIVEEMYESEEDWTSPEFIMDNFDNILKPFIVEKNYTQPIPEHLKRCLVDEICVTIQKLNDKRITLQSCPCNYLLPLTLIRIYKLDTVWEAMEKFGKTEFQFSVDYDRYKNHWQSEQIDVVYGDLRKYDQTCRFGSHRRTWQQNDFEIVFDFYYPTLKPINLAVDMRNLTPKQANNSPESRFIAAVGAGFRNSWIQESLISSKLTLPLLRYIYWFEFIFTPDGFIFKTEDCPDGKKINFKL